jgi:hypothetical protein
VFPPSLLQQSNTIKLRESPKASSYQVWLEREKNVCAVVYNTSRHIPHGQGNDLGYGKNGEDITGNLQPSPTGTHFLFLWMQFTD